MSSNIWRPIDFDSLSQQPSTYNGRQREDTGIEPIIISDEEQEITSSSSSLKSGLEIVYEKMKSEVYEESMPVYAVCSNSVLFVVTCVCV